MLWAIIISLGLLTIVIIFFRRHFLAFLVNWIVIASRVTGGRRERGEERERERGLQQRDQAVIEAGPRR